MGFKLSKLFGKKFNDSASYWEKRYASGRTSGDGSYGDLAAFKASVINQFVAENGIRTVVEFGCGDGNQLKLAEYPSYLGYDVSQTAIEMCRKNFSGDTSKKFRHIDEFRNATFDLALSLDVIYHLVEDDTFNNYMRRLFDSSGKYVIIYSNNTNETPPGTRPHVRWRRFSDWIDNNALEWKLLKEVKNIYPESSIADFFIYEKTGM